MTMNTIIKVWMVFSFFNIVDSFRPPYKPQDHHLVPTVNAITVRESDSLNSPLPNADHIIENDVVTNITKVQNDIKILTRAIEVMKADIQPDLNWVKSHKNTLKTEITNKIGTIKDQFKYDIDLFIQKFNNDLGIIEQDLTRKYIDSRKWGTEPNVEEIINEIISVNRRINTTKWEVKRKLDQIQLDLDYSIDLLKINVIRNIYSTDNYKRQMKYAIDSVIQESNNRFDSIQRNIQPFIEMSKSDNTATDITTFVINELLPYNRDIYSARIDIDSKLNNLRSNTNSYLGELRIDVVSRID